MKRIILKALSIAMIVFGILGIYTFVFVSRVNILKKAILITIAIGITLSGIANLLNSKRKMEGKNENSNS